MSKVCLIVTFSHAIKLTVLSCLLFIPAANLLGQDTANEGSAVDSKPEATSNESAEVTYPRSVATDGDGLLVVDLDLPGIWRVEGAEKKLYVRGTKLLRKPMNRPWCVVANPAGGILVGDSATREIYGFAEPDAEGKPLNNGFLGIPMAIAVDAAGETIYVGDAEKRAVFSMPIGGGKPELVARVNARALSFDDDGNLWAVTPDADAVQMIDVKAKTSKAIVSGRPYQFPGGLVWVAEHGYVTDTYGKSIWKFTADGKTEKWLEAEQLQRPVGITANAKSLFVADPKQKQVYEIDLQSKKVTPRL